MSRRPRTLGFYWDWLPGTSTQAVWRDFIESWVVAHARQWEPADLHWLSYIEEFMLYRKFERLSGGRLTRKAEAAAQDFLATQLAGGIVCKYCERMQGQTEGSKP